jgi:hypothetical protein
MPVGVAPRVEGAERTLKLLKELDPKLRRQTNRTIRKAAAPLVDGVRARLPGVALSNWTTGRYVYVGDEAARGVGVSIGKARGRTTMSAGRQVSTWPLISVSQRIAGGAVFDMAGRRSQGQSPQGRAFIRNLSERYGAASRSMWPGVEGEIDSVRATVLEAVQNVAKEMNRQLKVR